MFILSVDRLLSEGLELINTIPQGIDGATFALHLCRGNIQSHYVSAGEYANISGPLFSRLTAFDVFLLEYDDPRSGGFEPLADCPDEKVIVLGLISSKLPQLETTEVINRRIVDAATAPIGICPTWPTPYTTSVPGSLRWVLQRRLWHP